MEWSYHSWFQFHDRNGRGWAEPELFTVLKDCVVLFEMKLTGGPAGRLQMEGLYRPILEHVYRKPVLCCLVCKNVTPETPGPFFDSPEAFFRSGEKFGTWHWLGN